MSETEPQPESNLATIIQRVVADGDNERLRSFTSLLNTYNYAVQVQSKRVQWEPKDFRLFCIALTAMDQIGLHDEVSEKAALRAVQSAVETKPPWDQNAVETKDSTARRHLRDM